MARAAQPGPLAAEPSARLAFALVLGLGLLLFGVRLAGPPDLTDNDQEGPTAYVLDVVQNGHWWVQRDAHGEIASKPPLYSWLAALFTLATGGGASRLAMYLPCGLAVVGTALMVVRVGGRQFGVVAGFLAACSLYFCQFGIKHVTLARTDAVFLATVTLGALAAHRAWVTGRGWTGFWVAAAAASLTKGPLGLVLAGGGLLAVMWERQGGEARPLRLRFWPGAALYLALVGGWFALAYAQVGTALTEKQVGRELVGHLSGASAGGHWPGSNPFHPMLYFLARYAPWSLLACVGFWRVWRRPAASTEERRFERFLFCWFGVGLVVFIIAPHKRADLLLPLIPAAAMLAGRELARLLAGVRPVRVWQGAVAVGLVLLAGIPMLSRLKVEAAEVTAQTLAMKDLAAWLRTNAPPGLPLTFAGNAMTLEFYLNRHQFHTSPEAAAKLLGQPEAACFVAVADSEALRRFLPAEGGWHELARRPVGDRAFIHLLSNRPTLAAEKAMAIGVGPLSVRLTDATLAQACWLDLTFRAHGTDAEVTLVNTSSRPVTAGARWEGEATSVARKRTLAPGESWNVPHGRGDREGD